jgi:hypothetical protein
MSMSNQSVERQAEFAPNVRRRERVTHVFEIDAQFDTGRWPTSMVFRASNPGLMPRSQISSTAHLVCYFRFISTQRKKLPLGVLIPC